MIITLIFIFGMLMGILIGFALGRQIVNNKEDAYKIGLLDGFDLSKKYVSLNLDNDGTGK